MKILYRISDGGNVKLKPNYVENKYAMFIHFINIFKNNDIYIFADNVKEDLYRFLINNYDTNKIQLIMSSSDNSTNAYSLFFNIELFLLS
jgi:hypothetical protein